MIIIKIIILYFIQITHTMIISPQRVPGKCIVSLPVQVVEHYIPSIDACITMKRIRDCKQRHLPIGINDFCHWKW